jgi:hypothetical protein
MTQTFLKQSWVLKVKVMVLTSLKDKLRHYPKCPKDWALVTSQPFLEARRQPHQGRKGRKHQEGGWLTARAAFSF